MNILQQLVSSLGVPFLETTVLNLEIAAVGHQHKPEVVRALTVPDEPTLHGICSKLGRDFNQAKAARDAYANAGADYVLFLATGTVPEVANTATIDTPEIGAATDRPLS